MFGRKCRERIVVRSRRDDDLKKYFYEFRCEVSGNTRIYSDDAAECRDRVRFIGAPVSVERAGGNRCAARIGVLDDDTGRLVELSPLS